MFYFVAVHINKRYWSLQERCGCIQVKIQQVERAIIYRFDQISANLCLLFETFWL